MEALTMALPLWGLVFARAVGVALLVPPSGVRQVPVSIRFGAAAVIAVPLYYVAGESVPATADLATYALWVARNLVVGMVLGGAVAAVVWASAMAGTYADRLAGWWAAPTEAGPIGSIFYFLCATIFVLIDGHHAVLAALAGSFQAVPAGPGALAGLAREALILLPGRMFAASLLIAAPALLAVLIARALLAVAERVSVELASSGLNAVTAPLVVYVAVIAALPAVAYVALEQFRVVLEQVALLIG